MTNAQYAEHLLHEMAGNDLHLKNMQEEGNPFQGCFGFECPEGHRSVASDDCDTCPYHNFWDKEAERDEDYDYKRFCLQCGWNDPDYGCKSPAHEAVWQCDMYRYYHPEEVKQFECEMEAWAKQRKGGTKK